MEIDLGGCLENYKYFRSKLQDSTKLLVLVKANAYGHGIENAVKLISGQGIAPSIPVEVTLITAANVG